MKRLIVIILDEIPSKPLPSALQCLLYLRQKWGSGNKDCKRSELKAPVINRYLPLQFGGFAFAKLQLPTYRGESGSMNSIQAEYMKMIMVVIRNGNRASQISLSYFDFPYARHLYINYQIMWLPPHGNCLRRIRPAIRAATFDFLKI